MTGVRIGPQQQSRELQDLATRVQQIQNPGPIFNDPISLFTLKIGPNHSVQIAFRAAFTAGVLSVDIHRGATRDFGTSKQLASFPKNVLVGTVNYTDVDASLVGTKPFYWLDIKPFNADKAPIVHGPQQIGPV